MKPIITGVLASIAVVGLLSACADDSKTTSSGSSAGVTLAPGEPGETLPGGATLPSDVTILPGGSLPSDFSIPTEAIDQLIASFEAAGVKVDRACFEDLLKDDEFRNIVDIGGNTERRADPATSPPVSRSNDQLSNSVIGSPISVKVCEATLHCRTCRVWNA